MTKLVTIFGGSGFVGRYITRRMAQAGWRVRVAVRRTNEAIFVKPYGTVGQVEPIGCNIRDDASVAAALSGADAVVIVTEWNEFRALTPASYVDALAQPILIDLRNIYDPSEMREAGISYSSIGRK